MSNIPDGWIYALLSEIALIQMGQSPDSHSYNEQSEGLPFFQGKTDFGKLFPTVRKWCTEPKRVAEAGDLLLSVRAPVGPTNLAAERCCIGRGLAAIQAISPFNQKYLLHHFRNTEPWLSQQGTGSTFAGIGGDLIRSLKIPVAPLNEQKRIADKLDSLLSRVDACRDRLDRVPLILKRFQEAVLNAATSGQLTEDWWEKDISAEPTSTLLTRIEEERKQSYGGRYQEPLLPKGSVLEYLPQSWSLVTLDQISLLVTSGSRGWAKYYSHSGAYFIRTQNINNDQLNLDDVAYVNLPDGSEGERTRLQLGDLLITITGANVTKSALINSELPEAYVNQHLGLVRLVPSVCWEFIHLWIISPKHGRAQLTEAAYGNGKPGLNLTNLRQVLIALPPLKEQQEIVRRVKTLFAYADRLRSRYQNACVQVDRLTPALLDKAFRGELVAQDSNDEPASILLDHIRTEQAAQPTKPRRVLTDRKPNMTKTTEEFVKEVIRQMPQDTFSFDELRAKLSGDYDSLKDILFNLLDKSEPSIVQVFDQEAEAMRFVRGDK